ncbi:hypothetical protein [Sphingomonas sp. PR090111-T3T-6A]|uniref:hypothetical protein n=1 Tax=Sphingomonas sp. PR090111-T3T-6A TaxID=685778 RepID=UPI00035F5018|nr:hypothetical protein [Sphingomonas sp. PR090111-T3T-6A]
MPTGRFRASCLRSGRQPLSGRLNLVYSSKVRWTKRNDDTYQTVQRIGLDGIRGLAKASVKGTQIGMMALFDASPQDA